MSKDSHDQNNDIPSLPYAGMAPRVWAAILDFIACYLMVIVALFAMMALGLTDNDFSAVGLPVIVAMLWLYSAGFESSAAQATPGKKQARIVVTDAQGARISFVRASLRFAGKAVLVATGGLGLLTMLLDKQHRAADDFIAGTRVHDVEAIVSGGPRPWWRKALGPVIVAASIGTLAWIAIDAQNSFQEKARIANLTFKVREELQTPYETYYIANQHPPTVSELPFSHPRVKNIEVDSAGAIVLHLNQPKDGMLRMTPNFGEDGTVTWSCFAQAENLKAFPSNCRH